MTTLFRVATVKATGKKYLVMFIDFGMNKVVCHGEMVRQKGMKTWHDGTKSFVLSAVDIAPEAPKTQSLLDALWKQTVASKREEGHVVSEHVSRRGNKSATVYPKK